MADQLIMEIRRVASHHLSNPFPQNLSALVGQLEKELSATKIPLDAHHVRLLQSFFEQLHQSLTLDSKRREDFEIDLNSLLRSLEVELRSIQDAFGSVQEELGEIRSKLQMQHEATDQQRELFHLVIKDLKNEANISHKQENALKTRLDKLEYSTI